MFSSEPLTRLVQSDIPSVEPPPHLHLNRREQEILQLLAQAYSNAEIAERLYLSESTVKTYVSSVMAQLGVDSRLKAVVRAFEWNLDRTLNCPFGWAGRHFRRVRPVPRPG
ncbi:MAG: response regulator transcription factor [Gammaproteobacteria bacterium]|nr:response regulator transcription factor [Gammaproteobacteria bacterium]